MYSDFCHVYQNWLPCCACCACCDPQHALQAQQLLKQRFVIRPPSLDSNLHKNMTLALSPEKVPRSSIKANPILQDFAHEHNANLERDLEQRKIR